MKKLRILFLSENTVEGGHGHDMWAGIDQQTDYLEIIDFTKQYHKYGKNAFEKNMLDIIKERKINFVFIAQGTSFIIDISFLKQINQFTKLVMIFPDTEHNFEIDRYYAQCADLVWLLGPAGVQLHTLYGVKCIWTHGFDSSRYFKESSKQDIDVSFIGGINRSNRKEYIDYLLENNINIELYGDGTLNGKITNTQKNNIVSRSKINLNFTGVENKEKEIFKRVKQAKGRPMEVAMSSGFMLSEYAPQIEDMFDIDSEIDVFYTKEELLDKIHYYLKEEDKRISMAQKAYSRALDEYETNQSFKTVIDALNSLSFVEKSYYKDRNFIEPFVSVRFYYMARFFFSGEFKASKNELKTIVNYKSIRLRNFYFDIPRGIFHVLDKKNRYFRKIVNFLRN